MQQTRALQSGSIDHSTANSNAIDNGVAASDPIDHSTANSNAISANSKEFIQFFGANSDASDHSTANSNSEDNGLTISGASGHSTTDATASKQTIGLAIATNHQTSVVNTP